MLFQIQPTAVLVSTKQKEDFLCCIQDLGKQRFYQIYFFYSTRFQLSGCVKKQTILVQLSLSPAYPESLWLKSARKDHGKRSRLFGIILVEFSISM